ncbi:MAG: substrate-binding domain-containing protein [Planctomycetes bacterium]|nr:substrate-binding domain-containing protein [Planctomycetota bacterium]
MKRLALFVLAGLVAGVLGCAPPAQPPQGSAPADSKKPLRLIFITTLVHEEFFQPVKKGMEDAARLVGVQATFTGTEGVDAKAQAAMVTKAVADGYDGIAVDLIDPAAFDDAVKAAIDKGVPVVAFNTDDTTPNARLSSVNQNLYEAGRVLGRRALEFIPPGGSVLIAMHDEGISALEDRCRGMTEELGKKNVKWKRFIAGSDPVKAREIIARNLKENPDTKIVLCTGQADLEPVALVIEKQFKDQGYAVAGFDLSPTILRLMQADIIKFTIDQQPYVQGFYPVIQLALYCRYGIKPSSMDAGAFVITKEDAAAVMELKKANFR